VDDILALSNSLKSIMETIRKAYRLKEEPVIPSTYLGVSIKQWSIPGDDKVIWRMN